MSLIAIKWKKKLLKTHKIEFFPCIFRDFQALIQAVRKQYANLDIICNLTPGPTIGLCFKTNFVPLRLIVLTWASLALPYPLKLKLSKMKTQIRRR